MIEITSAAAERIKGALGEASGEGLSLRVAALRDPQGQIEYGMGFDERREQDEEVVTDAGITLLVSPPSLDMLSDAVIDFVEIEPGDHRFVFYRRGDVPSESGES
jgi:iron-sulfur cluster assembly protein